MPRSFQLGLIFSLLFYLQVEIQGSPRPHKNVPSSNISQNIFVFSSTWQIPFRQTNTSLLSSQWTIDGPQTMQDDKKGYGLKRRKRYTDRIVGGTQAEPHEFPHQVYLTEYNHFFCAGSIISKWLILTAAHCLRDVNVSALTVTAGAHQQSDNSGVEQIRTVDEMVIHPNYTRDKKNHDIAILVPSEPFSLSAAVGSIRLPNRDATFSGSITVTGWGNTVYGGTRSDVLKKVTVPIVRNSQCKTQYADITITEQMFCAGEKGKDSCQGDSGGPALCISGEWNFENSTVLCGIVSFGKGCGRAGYPGVYVQVSKYIGWIIGVLNNRTLENHCFRNSPTPWNTTDWTRCVTKYALPETETTPCGIDQDSGFLLVTHRTTAQRFYLDQMGAGGAIALSLGSPEGNDLRVDFDLKGNWLYWAYFTDEIKPLHMDGNSLPEVFVVPKGFKITGLAFDWMSDNLYFADFGRGIGVIRTNGVSSGFQGQMYKLLLTCYGSQGIAVHPAKGYIFWTQRFMKYYSISRAHLDGSHETILYPNDDSWSTDTRQIVDDPRSIALDYVKNRIYWSDIALRRLMSADLNGDDVTIVLQADSRISMPLGIAFHKSIVYWTDNSTNALYKAPIQLDKTVRPNSIAKLVKDLSDPYDMKVFDMDSQKGENLCTHSNCKYICMVSPGPQRTVSCICPDGFTKKNGECI